MKGYSTTLSCWGGETYPPAQNGFASCCCKQVKTIRAIGGLHHCYPCSTAVSPVCCRPGDNTLHRMVNINLNCRFWHIEQSGLRMAHRHYDCYTLLAITAACILLQACCSHEQLLFMYLFIMHDMNWRSQRRGERAEPSGLDLTTQHKEFENVKVESCL